MEPELVIGMIGLLFSVLGTTWFLASKIGKIQGALDLLGVKVARIEKLEVDIEQLEKDFHTCREQHLRGVIG